MPEVVKHFVKKNKLLLTLFLILLVISYLFFRNQFLGNPRLILNNVGVTNIDSIHVVVSGNTYLLENLSKGGKKTIRIDPLTDSNIILFTENKKNKIIINTYLDRASTGGYIKAKITQDSLVYFKHEVGFL